MCRISRLALLAVAQLIVCVSLASAGGSSNEFTKLLEKCSSEKRTFECLKRRALDILERAAKDDSVYVINDFVSIGKDRSSAKESSKHEDNATAERSLDESLENRLYQFLSSRSIQLTIPGDTFEGRKKKGDKMGALMVGGLAMAGMMAQLAFGKIAFIAGTALLTAKIALVLSAIIGLKKLVSGGGGGHEVIYATASEHHGGGYGGWQRSVDVIPPAT